MMMTKIDYDHAGMTNTGGGVMIAAAPLEIWVPTNRADTLTSWWILAGPDGVGIYSSEQNPLIDDAGFDCEVVYRDWSDCACYSDTEDGDDVFTGYDFDSEFSDVMTSFTYYYKAYETSEGSLYDYGYSWSDGDDLRAAAQQFNFIKDDTYMVALPERVYYVYRSLIIESLKELDYTQDSISRMIASLPVVTFDTVNNLIRLGLVNHGAISD